MRKRHRKKQKRKIVQQGPEAIQRALRMMPMSYDMLANAIADYLVLGPIHTDRPPYGYAIFDGTKLFANEKDISAR